MLATEENGCVAVAYMKKLGKILDQGREREEVEMWQSVGIWEEGDYITLALSLSGYVTLGKTFIHAFMCKMRVYLHGVSNRTK